MSFTDTLAYNVALHDVFSFRLIIRGLRRILGDAQEHKLPVNPEMVSRLLPLLIASENSGFWAAMLIAFYSFFRKSSLVHKTATGYDTSKTLSRQDIFVRP